MWNMVGLPACLLRQLLSIQNAVAWLVYRLRCFEHITEALVSRHCLQLLERIIFKVALQTYRAVHADAPLDCRQFTRPTDIRLDNIYGSPAPICLFLPFVLLLDITPSLSLVHVCRTVYFQSLPPHRLYSYI